MAPFPSSLPADVQDVAPDVQSSENLEATITELRECLAVLDRLGLTTPGNHVSMAIDLLEQAQHESGEFPTR